MKILVGYDDSELCKDALKLAKKHAEAFKGEVIALTSLDVPDTVAIQEAEQALAAAGKIFDGGTVQFTAEVSARGMTSSEDLVRFAAEHEVDEIIVGVKKRSKVGKMLFGSTLQNVVLNAPCPVLTIK
jgi:nucleotide-binding universal stress UspA family protein